MQVDTIVLESTVQDSESGKRLDQTLAVLYPEYSRERLKSWILSGECLLNNKKAKPKDKVKSGEKILIKAIIKKEVVSTAEKIPLDIIFEDDDLLVINKPSNLVVHPAAGNKSGTLLNGLLHHCHQLDKLPRAGIVHRLDKDTTGLMVVAKTLTAHNSLVDQLQNREIKRVYQAVVEGVMTAGGTVETNMGRHPRDRIKMAVVESDKGKEAITYYRAKQKYSSNTLVELNLETGRTHQIRVHMAHIGYPIVGDQLYGKRMKIPKNASEELIEFLRNFKRQALHAKELQFIHPRTKEKIKFACDLPNDLKNLISILEK